VDYFDWPSRDQNSHPAPQRSKSYDDIANIDQKKNKPSNSLIDPVVSNVNTFSQENTSKSCSYSWCCILPCR